MAEIARFLPSTEVYMYRVLSLLSWSVVTAILERVGTVGMRPIRMGSLVGLVGDVWVGEVVPPGLVCGVWVGGVVPPGLVCGVSATSVVSSEPAGGGGVG